MSGPASALSAFSDSFSVLETGNVKILNQSKLREHAIDRLVYGAVFETDPARRSAFRWGIRALARESGVVPASIQSLYEAMGRGEVSGFTVPAINIRGLTYDSTRAVFRAMEAGRVGPVIFEIAKSEIGYTEQRPDEYAVVILAAAIREGYSGPVFLQGDHFQINAKKFGADPSGEVNALKAIAREAVEAGFYNIDIDASTVVDLSKGTIEDQQFNNSHITAEMTKFIRGLEPKSVMVSVGGEIGEVGGKNSTVEELSAFMDVYRRELGGGLQGISKISVQTGTSHGGVVLPDGTVAKVKLDFDTLQSLSKAAREKYGLSGAVQHGASTLPDEAFGRFPETGTSEVHLATGFQNMIYEHPRFPAALKEKAYDWCRANCAGERKGGETEEQFLYKTRKKTFGPFKKEMWDLPAEIRNAIGADLEAKFRFLFDKLRVVGTRDVVGRIVKPVAVPLSLPSGQATKGGGVAIGRDEPGE
ncbi:MAG: aldolase [Nitrospirae bacterium RBG_16_64_22]|nr:MAG: aldolase [Nitrospirae bacterium RBG_16_64_22]